MLNGDRDDRALGLTFPLDKVGFFDFETLNTREDLKEVGAYRYALSAQAIILTFAIGDGPVHTLAVDQFRRAGRRTTLDFADMPLEFVKHHAKVMNSTAVWCAWNSGFDRRIWNHACAGFPVLEPQMCIDAMVQAVANGLPPDLSMAAKLSNSIHKVADGAALIDLFCKPPRRNRIRGNPQSHPAEWARFKVYAATDIEAMRSVYKGTRQLPLAEWKEFWCSETINDRGVGVDVDMAKHAAVLAREDKIRSGGELMQLTGGHVATVGQVSSIVDWVMAALPPEGRKILTARLEELDDDGELVKPAKYSLRRNRVEKLTAYTRAIGLENVTRVLEIRRYGGSTTPAKFQKILDQHVGGRLFGSYMFNGAPQTGKFSSRGVQIHNLARDYIDYEHAAIEAILAGCSYDDFAELGDDTPVSRKLSLLIRPCLVARPGMIFTWSDWRNIEARILPWLAGDDIGAKQRLQIFRDCDADPSLPDLYTRTAAVLSNLPIEQVTKPIRQRGKVAELALGFGGAFGALQAMAAGYGLHIPEEEGKAIVTAWRQANGWCVRFWGRHDDDESYGLWGAALTALDRPKQVTQAGRIRFVYVPELMKSLLMILPSGRVLTYRDIRFETVDIANEDDEVIGRERQLRFHKGYYRSKIWYGTFCENAVQAVAADFMRGTLVRLEAEGLGAVFHTHDEIGLEVAEDQFPDASRRLGEVMVRGFPWSDGLPLASEQEIGYYYSKLED